MFRGKNPEYLELEMLTDVIPIRRPHCLSFNYLNEMILIDLSMVFLGQFYIFKPIRNYSYFNVPKLDVKSKPN